MKIRRYLFLLILIILTVLHWQFRWVNTGVFYATGGFSAENTWKTSARHKAPDFTLEGESAVAVFRSENWPATQLTQQWTAKEKTRVRAELEVIVEGMNKLEKGAPCPAIYFVGQGAEGKRIIPDDHQIWRASENSNSFITHDVIMAVPQGSTSFSVAITFPPIAGEMRVKSLKLSQVKQVWWWGIAASFLILGWVMWVFSMLRGNCLRLLTLFTAMWLVGWGMFQVFPRSMDIPRPFFSSFWIDDVEKIQRVMGVFGASEDRPDNEIQPKKEAIGKVSREREPQGIINIMREWFQDFSGGRFLMHFGMMGVCAGGAFLMCPRRCVWAFLSAIAIGTEIVPYFWYRRWDVGDSLDLMAYALAILASAWVARWLLSQKWCPRWWIRARGGEKTVLS